MNGLTTRALERRVARTLGTLRLVGVAFEAAAMGWRWDWYATPAHLVVPVVSGCWGVVFGVLCLRRGLGGRLGRRLTAGELVVGLLTAGGIVWAVPPDELAAGPNWVLLRLVGTSLTVVWCARWTVWVPATLLLIGTEATAVQLAAEAPAAPAQTACYAAVMTGVAAVFAVTGRFLRSGAARADAWLERAGARQRGLAVAAARRRDLRESDRIVHDTVLNTLTGIAWGAQDAGTDTIRSRCIQGVAVCEELLAGGKDWDDGLVVTLGRVLDQARADGLAVSLTLAGEPEVPVPAQVAAAVGAAVREALSNVRRHSGVRHAQVEVRGGDGGLVITVTDHGRGFTPGGYRPEQLGIRRSILDRMGDIGGSATISSAPGQPTVVTLRWSPAAADSVPVEAAELEARSLRDATRAVSTAALLWHGLLGMILLARIGYYQRPALVLLAWAVSGMLLACCVANRLRHWPQSTAATTASTPADADAETDAETTQGTTDVAGSRGSPESAGTAGTAEESAAAGAAPVTDGTARLAAKALVAAMVAAFAAAQAVAVFAGRPGSPIPLNWAMIAALGMLAFLAVSWPPRTWLPASAAIAGVSIAMAAHSYTPETGLVGYLGTFLYGQGAVQATVAGLGPLRRATAQATAEAARAKVALAAELVASAEVARDRRARLARLRADALPLLMDIGAGRLDPHDSEVRARCAACAAVLRRTLTHSPAGSALLGELEPAVRAAEERGVTVRMQVAGALDTIPAPACDELVQALARLLDGVSAGQATVTVTSGGDTGSAFVTANAAAASTAAPSVPSGPVWTELIDDSEDGQICVEIRWRPPEKAGPPGGIAPPGLDSPGLGAGPSSSATAIAG